MRTRRAVAILTVLAALWPAAAPAQSEDPAILLCEAREQPKPADPTYRRVAGVVRGDLAVIVFEIAKGVRTERQEARCQFKLNPADRKWHFVDEKDTPVVAGCNAQIDRVKVLMQTGQMDRAKTEEGNLVECRDAMKVATNREAFRLLLSVTISQAFTYPIDPAATRLQR